MCPHGAATALVLVVLAITARGQAGPPGHPAHQSGSGPGHDGRLAGSRQGHGLDVDTQQGQPARPRAAPYIDYGDIYASTTGYVPAAYTLRPSYYSHGSSKTARYYGNPYQSDGLTSAGSYQNHQTYHETCDCSQYDLLGLLAGGAALAAIGLFLILQAQAAANGGGGGRTLQTTAEEWLSPWMYGALRDTLPDNPAKIALNAVNSTCQLARHRDGPQSRTGYGSGGGYGGGCDCFPGLVGAVAGFAALAALIAFSLAQAAAAAAAGGGRSLPNVTDYSRAAGTGMVDPTGLRMLGRLAGLLSEESLRCIPAQLCDVTKMAARSGEPYSSAVKLASLPVSYLLTRAHPGSQFTTFCSSVLAADAGDCSDIYTQCAQRLTRRSAEARNETEAAGAV